MSANTVSQVASNVNSDALVRIDFLNEEMPIVSSLDVARHFQKKHAHILRDIERIRTQVPEIFYKSNFGPMVREAEIGSGATRKFPYYTLTRDAFSLLVMGFTGAAAIRWKLKYIEAFNSLENAVRENIVELAREVGYRQGLDYAKSAPALEAARQVAFDQGFKEGSNPKNDRLVKVRKAYAYMKNNGLGLREAATLVDMSYSLLGDQLEALGLRTRQKRVRPAQGEV